MNIYETKNCFVCNSRLIYDLDRREGFPTPLTIDCPACGQYKLYEKPLRENYQRALDEKRTSYEGQLGFEQWPLVSGFLREFQEKFHQPYDFKSISEVLSKPMPRGLLDVVDKLLLYLDRKILSAVGSAEIDPKTDFPLAYADSPEAFANILVRAEELGYLQTKVEENLPTNVDPATVTRQVSPDMEGWQRLKFLRETHPDSKQAFVAMWFGEEMSDAFNNGLEKGIKEAGYVPMRIDAVEHNDKICDRIMSEIRKSKFVVCDLTGHRGGAYFEAGFALGLGLPVIWTCREDHFDNLHFDIRQYSNIKWSAPEELCEKLKNRIEATIPKKTN